MGGNGGSGIVIVRFSTTGNGTNTYSGATTIEEGAINFSNGAIGSSGDVTFTGGALQWATGNTQDVSGRIKNSTGAIKIDTNGNNVAFASAITSANGNTGGLTKSGSGVLTLTGANTYTGLTTVSAGELDLNTTGNNSIAGNLTVSAGTAKLLRADQIANTSTVTILGTGILDMGSFNDTVDVFNMSAGQLNGTGTLTANTYNVTGGTVNALLGAGTLTATTGTTTLDKASQASIVNVNSGTLALGASNLLSNSAAMTVAGGILSMGNFNNTVAGVQLTGGSISGSGGTLTSTSAFDMQAGSVSAKLGGTVGLNKTTSGTVTLTGANSYSGTTTVSAGTLELSGGSAIADAGAVSMANVSSAILKLSASEAIGTLSGGGTSGGNVNLQGYTLTVNEATDTGYAGALSGTGGLTKAGAGTLSLSGANIFTGTTTVSNGILAQTAGTNTSTTLSVGTNASYTLSGGTLSAANVSGTGTVNLSGGTLSVSGTYSGPTLNMTSGTLKGSGTIANTSFTVDADSIISPGNSPGTITFSGGTQTWAGGGSYLWQLYDTGGIAGTAWDLVNLTNSATINVTASTSDKFTIAIQGLSGLPDTLGNPLGFSANQNYSWKIVDGASGAINNFDATKFAVTVSGITGVDTADFRLSYTGDLILSYYGATAPPSGTTTYMANDVWGGSVNDAEKSVSNNYCWAAAASNVLDWTGWSTPSPASFSSTDSVFSYYRSHWTNLGGDMKYGWQWFFDGTNPSAGWENWSQVSTPGGNFWSSSYTFSNFYQINDNDVQAMAAIESYLKAGYGVGLGLYGPGGHAVTAWGFKFDETSGKYLGVYITDSDDSIGNNTDQLKYYDVVEINGKWYLQNFYGSNSWYIGEVEGLETMTKDLIGTAVGSLNLGYSSDDIMALIKYYADKKDGISDPTLVIDGINWYYYSGLLPGDDGSKNIGDSWKIGDNYYIKLGSGLYSGQQPLGGGGDGVPEPATVVGLVLAALGMAVRKRRLLRRQS
jgi:autotransporter-associated beta strand protein